MSGGDPRDPEAADDAERLLIAAAEAVERGAWPEAIDAASRVLAGDADDPEGLLLLGLGLAGSGEWARAIGSLERAVELDPEHAQASASLSEVRARCGDRVGAAEAAERAWRAAPADRRLARRAATLLAAVDRFEAALPPAQLLASDGDPPDVVRFAELLVNLDRGEEAVERLETLRRLRPDDPELPLRLAVARLPMIPATSDDARRAVEAFDSTLSELARDDLPIAADGNALVAGWPFRVAALAEPDPARARVHGERVRLAAVSQFGERAADWPRPASPRRLRLGLVSGLWRDHVVARLLLDGWTRHLDRSRFEVLAIDVGRRRDTCGSSLQDRCEAVLSVGKHAGGLRAMVDAIAARRFDILLWPEVGMDPLAARLAALRLARLQAVAWGHPETTGLSAIDLFLASEAMEPADGDDRYTERLVRLPGLGACVSRPSIPAAAERATLGWSKDAIVCWCAQTPHKHVPRFDALYARIAAAVPAARFVFTTPRPSRARQRFEARLHRAFAGAGADPVRQLEFMEVLPTAAFRARLAAADLFLDPPGWSGGHTTLEAVAAGLPVITLPGAFMRRRHAFGVLRVLDPRGEWSAPSIAESETAYVERAVAIATDPSLRSRLAAAVAEHAHRAFDDPTPIRALETVLAGLLASD